MAFRPASVDYVGHQSLRQKALGNVTRAKLQTKLRKEEEERRAAAARAASKKKSGFGRKLVGAVARGAAAYYSGGASEASGLGAMLDQQIQGGSDYERNEYGDMVGAASTMSGMMTAKKVGDATMRLNAQSSKDDAMQERMDKISPRAGLAYAEKREAKDAANRKVFEEYKSGFLNFGRDVDGLDLSATTMDYSGITKGKKIEAQPAQPAITYATSGEQDDRLGGQNVSTVPIKEANVEVLAEDFEGKNVTSEQQGFFSGYNNNQAIPPATTATTTPVGDHAWNEKISVIDPNRRDDQGQSPH